MSNLFGNHSVGFSTRWLLSEILTGAILEEDKTDSRIFSALCQHMVKSSVHQPLSFYKNRVAAHLLMTSALIRITCPCYIHTQHLYGENWSLQGLTGVNIFSYFLIGEAVLT